MIRKDFLKKLLGYTGIFLLPIKKLIPAKKKRTWLIQFHVRGFQYYSGPDITDQMKPGEQLTLVREPHNQFDNDAISLFYYHWKIGYVPREKNEVISRMLDSGYGNIKAELIKIDRNVGPWDAVYVGIYLENELSVAA